MQAARPSSSTASSPPPAATAQRCVLPAARPQTSPAGTALSSKQASDHAARITCDEVGLSLHSFAKVRNKNNTQNVKRFPNLTAQSRHACAGAA
jgi:hypothetical protein